MKQFKRKSDGMIFPFHEQCMGNPELELFETVPPEFAKPEPKARKASKVTVADSEADSLDALLAGLESSGTGT